MNEEALQEAFRLFASQGYNGDINKFVNLVSTNQDALQEAHRLFASQGYNGDINKFKTLIGVGQQQPAQQPEQQPVVQPTVKKKDDMDSDWLFGDGSSESEPSKTEQGVDYKKAFTTYNKQLFEPKTSETDIVDRAQKVLGINQPQQEQVGEYDPNAYIKGIYTPKEPVIYSKPEIPFRNVEGGYADVQNELAIIDKKIAESSPYEASLLVLERNKLLLRKKEIEDSPVRASDNRPFDITAPKFLEDGLNALTPKQLASYGAKGAKETFDYYFKDAGFKFETDREYVKAISPDGEVYTYNTLYPSRKSLDEFKNFVRESAFNNPQIADKAYLYEKENKKFKTKEEISNEVKTINAQEEGFMGDYKKMVNLKRDIDEIEADLKRWRDFGEQNTPKYIQTEAYLNERKKEYNENVGTIKEKETNLISQRTQLDKAVGKYTEFQATQGDFGGNVYRTITNTISGNFSQFLRLAVGKTIDVTPMSFLLGEENYQSQRDIRLKEKGYKDEKVVPISVLNEIDDEIREEFKKAAISGKVGDEKLNNILTVQGVRQAMSETLNAPITTTDEYLRERQEKGSWIERGLLGFSGSLPAMVGGPAMRYINMYLMNTDAAMQEMDNNPNFANISENEKQLVALPIGVVSAALEEIGLKNLKLGKSITSGIIKTVIGRVPAGASASVIRNTTFDVVAEMGIKGTSAYVGGLLSEAETGIFQQASEYAIKDIYESKWFKNRDMFDNPAFLSGQYIYDLYDSGRTEMVGAGVTSVPYSIAAAYQKDGFQALDDATFKIFEDLAKDDNGRKFFVTSLKNKINLGEVTPTQGKQMLEAYDQASGMIGMVPDEITDPESRKVAMDLMSERKKLEKQKYGKDEALAKPIQNKIDKINEQLTQLTQDAIQKQAASEVSLQPETEPSKEMEAGGPEAGPQAAPKQGVLSPEESERKQALEEELEWVALQEGGGLRFDLTGIYVQDKIISLEDAQAELDALNQKEQAVVTEQGGMEQASAKLTPEESKAKENDIEQRRKEELKAFDNKDNVGNLGDGKGDFVISVTAPDGKRYKNEIIAEYDAELAALQAAPAEGLGTQLETVAKEEQTPAEVTPAPKTTTDIITSAPIEIKGGVVITDSNGNDVMVNGNEQVAAKLYDEAMAIPEDQRTPEQNDIVEKVQRIISQAAAEVTPAETTPAEVTPVEQQFTEQDRARKAELEEAMRKADKRRKNITVGETTMPKAEAKAELAALNQKEQAAQQPVTVEAAPTATAPVETMTAEQEADLLEELMTGKKKETAPTETAPTTPTAEPLGTETVTEAAPVVEEVVPVKEEVSVQPETAPVAEEKLEIILGGLNDGYKAVSKNSFDVRSDNSVMDEVSKQKSFAKIITRKGKKYAVVGLALETKRPASTVGRDNYSFAMVEMNESTPNNIIEILEQNAKENFKNIYRDFSENDVVKPITTKDAGLPTAEVKAEPTSKEAKVKKSKFIDKKGKVNIEEILKTLSDRFSIPFEIINDPDQNYSGKFEDGRVYVNLAYVTAETAWHEFAHPFIEQVKADNPNLYNSLKEEILNTDYGKKILSEVESLYPELNKEDQIEEAIVETIARFVTGKIPDAEINNPKNKTLLGKIIDFINGIRTAIAKVIGIEYNKDNNIKPGQKSVTYKDINIASLGKGFKLKHFAQMMQYGHRINLKEYSSLTANKKLEDNDYFINGELLSGEQEFIANELFEITEKLKELSRSFNKKSEISVASEIKDAFDRLKEVLEKDLSFLPKEIIERYQKISDSTNKKLPIPIAIENGRTVWQDVGSYNIIMTNASLLFNKLPLEVKSKTISATQFKNQWKVKDFGAVYHNIGAYMNNAGIKTIDSAIQNFIDLLSSGDSVELATYSAKSSSMPGGLIKIQFKQESPVIRSYLRDIQSALIKEDGQYKRIVPYDMMNAFIRTDINEKVRKSYDELFVNATKNNIKDIEVLKDISPEELGKLKELSNLTGAPIVQNNQTIYEPSTKREYKPESVKYSKFTPTSLADAVRKNLTIKTGGLQSNILGVPIAIWNAGVLTAAKAIDASVAASKAIQQGVNDVKNWIKKNNPSLSLSDAKIKNKILIDLYEGTIKTARENNVKTEGLITYFKRKGLSDAQIDVLLKDEKKKAEKPELSEETLPGYTKLMNRINDIIARGRRKGKTDDDIMKGVIANVESRSPEYANATDQQREQIIRDIRKLFGKKEKAAPSAAKITGKPKPKKVTVNEMTALKDQLRLEAKAAREAKGDLNTKRKMLTAAIKEMKKKGSISVRQAKALINRVNAVNLDNPVMVERLLTYAENIFNDADYDTRVQEVRKLQEQVKKVNHVSMRDTVREFASINPERIPADKLLDYIQALDDMNTRTPFYEKMNDMFDEVMSYKSESKEFDAIKTFQALIDKLESIAINQVKSVEDYVALVRDINSFKRKAYQLLQNGDITQDQYDQAIENVGKDQAAVEKKYEKELTALKKGLVQEIIGLRPEVHPDFTPEEAALINKYLELSEADLESLSPEDLYILNDLLNNIKEDVQLDYYRLSEIVSKAYTNAGGQKLAEQLKESKFNKSSDEGKKLLLEQESAFWEGLLGLGRATSGALQKFIVSPFNRAIASFENFMKDGYSDFLKLKKKYRMKNYNMHRLGVFTTYLQEYMAQFDPANKNVKDIGKRDWFGEIISNEGMRDGYKSAKPSAARLIGMGNTELKTIEKIHKSLPKDANGKVDPKAVYDSFMANDGKFFTKQEKAFFDKIMEWKQKNLTTKQKAANEMSGMPFKEIPFHMMRVRLDQGAKQISPKAEGGAGKVRIEAGTGKERSSQKVGPIMTNFEQLFTENLEQTARNYYLREAINDINNTLSVAKKGLDKNKTGLFNTIPGTISEALNFEFDKSQFLASNLLAARAAETLLSPLRTAIELTSTFLSYPFRAKTPKGYRELFGKQGKMKKLLEFTSSPLRLRDNINKAIDISDGRIKPLGKFEKALNYLSGLPERTMMVTSWMPTFNNEFKDITGVRFDMDKFNSSAEYRQKYGKAIKEAAAVADAQTEKIIGSTTKAGGRREIRIAPKILANVFGLEGTVKKNTSAGQILGFFSNYPYREITEFLNGFKEAAEVYKQGGGAIKSVSQLQKPLGVVINLAAYGFLSSVVYAMKLMLLGDDEDEEKGEAMLKELMTPKGFMDELQGNAISLGASKYATGGKAMLQMFATIAYNSTSDKEQKARIKKILKNSVFVEPIDAEKVQGYGGKNELIGAISSYVPQAVLLAKRIEETIQTAGELNYIYKKFQDGGLNALSEDEGLAILAIDGLLKTTQTIFNFTGTSLPMYNDIKMYMKGAKKEAGVGNIKLTATENKHKEALQNYKNEKVFKENDPDGYLKAIDEGGSLYEYKLEQSKKEEEANKDKPFRGMSEEAFKKKYTEEYIENYGPGTEYYEEQRTPEAIEKRAEMRALQKKENAIKAKNKKKQDERYKEE
jgi:hypothetical protein